MPRETVKIILDKVDNKTVSKPINLHPGYDLVHIINYQTYYFDYNQYIKMIEIEKQYNDLSIIRSCKTPQQ